LSPYRGGILAEGASAPASEGDPERVIVSEVPGTTRDSIDVRFEKDGQTLIVIDTAGTDSHLTRLAHSMANTLITPLNDSFVDLSVLATVDPETYEVTADGELLTCAPAEVLPMAQRYFLF